MGKTPEKAPARSRGRPPADEKLLTINMRLSADDLEAADRIVKESGGFYRDRSHFVRLAVKALIKSHDVVPFAARGKVDVGANPNAPANKQFTRMMGRFLEKVTEHVTIERQLKEKLKEAGVDTRSRKELRRAAHRVSSAHTKPSKEVEEFEFQGMKVVIVGARDTERESEASTAARSAGRAQPKRQRPFP